MIVVLLRYLALIAVVVALPVFASNYVLSLALFIALHAMAAFGLSLLMALRRHHRLWPQQRKRVGSCSRKCSACHQCGG